MSDELLTVIEYRVLWRTGRDLTPLVSKHEWRIFPATRRRVTMARIRRVRPSRVKQIVKMGLYICTYQA